MANSDLDDAIASEDWAALLAAVEGADDPAAAVQRAEPLIAGWPDERRELPTELWRQLADRAEPPAWLPLTRALRLEEGDDLDGVARAPWLTSLDLTEYDGSMAGLAHVPGLRRLAIRVVDAGAMAGLTRLESLTVQQPDVLDSLGTLPLGPGLRVLVIGHSELVSLDGMERAAGLQRLELPDHPRLTDVAGLAALTSLQPAGTWPPRRPAHDRAELTRAGSAFVLGRQRPATAETDTVDAGGGDGGCGLEPHDRLVGQAQRMQTEPIKSRRGRTRVGDRRRRLSSGSPARRRRSR